MIKPDKAKERFNLSNDLITLSRKYIAASNYLFKNINLQDTMSINITLPRTYYTWPLGTISKLTIFLRKVQHITDIDTEFD